MTSISKQSKISARKLIKENFILCFLTALLFTLPSQIFYFLPVGTGDAISFAIQLAAAPLILAGCKAYLQLSQGDKTIKPTAVFYGYIDNKTANLGMNAVGKTLLISIIYVLIPTVILIIVAGVLLINLGIKSSSVDEIYAMAVLIGIAILPLFIMSCVQNACVYLGTIACYFNGKDKSRLKEHIKIFKRQKIKVLGFIIGPSLLYAALVIADIFLFFGSQLITLTIGIMYNVACLTFYAKYTLDENIQNGTIQADTSIISEEIYSDEQKYSGVNKDLL